MSAVTGRNLFRCKCGRPSKVQATYGDTPINRAMNQVTRWRHCAVCFVSFTTTEVDSAELADLRRRAYLYERQA